MFELKPLSREGIAAALAKAERYRFLGEPWEADSICRDILAIEPHNQKALVTLISAIAQELGEGIGGDLGEAKALVKRLESEYDRAYYLGVVLERRAKDLIARGTLGVGPVAYEFLAEAMQCYEEAEQLRATGDDSAILRWNTCARVIARNNLKPAPGPPSGLRH